MTPKELTLGPMTAADADAICLSQTPAGGGVQNLTLNGTLVSGGVATLDIPRRVAVACAADETARTFTVYGTDRYGNTISEAIAGVNASSAGSLLDYKTVTQVTVDNNTTGAVEVGTNAVASTAWVVVDTHRNPVNIALRVDQTGTATWSIEHTLDPNVCRSLGPFNVANHDDLAGQSASAQGNYAFPVSAFRLTTSAYTNPAALTLHATQSGLRGA